MKTGQDRFWESPPKRRLSAQVQMIFGYVNVAVLIIQGIVLVPLYLRHIEVRLYGLWLATGGITLWLGLLDLGIARLMGQRIASAYGKKNSELITLYYFNGMIIQALLMGLLVLSATGIAWFLPGLLGAVDSEIPILRLCIFFSGVSLGFTILNYGQLNAVFALQRPLVPLINNMTGGFVTIGTIILFLSRGAGLYSIPIGMLFGSFFSFLTNLFYGALLFRKVGGYLRLSRPILSDMIKLVPSIIVGKTGNALAGRIEPTLITLMITPEMAVNFSLTKRAADIIKMVMDKIVGSVFAGFAHLYAGGNFEKSRQVFRQLVFACYAVGLIGLGAYIATNRTFINLWVGQQFFSGQMLTVLLALSVFALVFNNFFTQLLGATGDIAKPALLIGVEALVRVLMMVCLLPWLGLPGLPIAILSGGVPFMVIYFLRLNNRLKLKSSPEASKRSFLRIGLGLVIFGCCFAIGWFVNLQSWPGFVVLVLAVSATSAILLPLLFPSNFRPLIQRILFLFKSVRIP